MTTDELIRELRIYADWFTDESEAHCTIHEAADRLEELDERVAIMTEPGTDPACEPDGASP